MGLSPMKIYCPVFYCQLILVTIGILHTLVFIVCNRVSDVVLSDELRVQT